MPYLPIFVLLFLPLPGLPFTASYAAWSGLNLLILVAYMARFSRAWGVHPQLLRLAQWMICLPVLSNLALGQVNVYLVVCLGEFILAYHRGQPRRSGLWLASLLIKPQVLVLLIPALLVSQNWAILLGFGMGLLGVLGASLLLSGVEGVQGSLNLAFRFAGPLIQTGPSMINWRALALNLQPVLPDLLAWIISAVGMVITVWWVLDLWRRQAHRSRSGIMALVLAACVGAFTVSWHAHFYLLTLLLPILFTLDSLDKLPTVLLAVWSVGMPVVYLLAYTVQPELAHSGLGLTYLAFNLGLLVWIRRGFIRLL